MINKLMQLIAPHYCYGCGKVGMVLCQNCKYDIGDESFDRCLVCSMPTMNGICFDHRTSYEKAWCVGERTAVLERLIDVFKFERVSDAAEPLASLLDTIIPILPPNSVVVPLPTVRSHVRQRGYDHTLLLAKRLAKLRNLPCNQLLRRNGSFVQRGRSKRDRYEQAKNAYICAEPANPDAVYILVDDVVTTNASVRFAAQGLLDAGATKVWVAVLARQALDKTA